ncbi:MAG: SPOR domain-containing protein [Treponema sp.]|nr:SPOR domain-containing protein [Treponema sp.]
MEQKRTLWILIAAGLFLCLVIGTAFLLFGNSQKNNESAMSKKDSGSMWVIPDDKPLTSHTTSYGYADDQPVANQGSSSSAAPSLLAGTSTPAEAAPNSITHADSVTVISQGSTNVYEIPSGTSAIQDGTTTIDLNSLKEGTASASSVKAQNQVAAQAIENTKAAKSAPKVLESSSKKSTASTSTKKASSKSTSKASSSTKSVLAAPSPDRYWVQVGSFVNKKYADEARSVLESKSIKCEVFTYEDSGTLKYRLRAGDYTSRTEAEYWQKQIDKIDYFAKNAGSTMIVHTGKSLAKK